MLKNVLIVLAIASLAGAAYFAYDRWSEDHDLSTWSFVPEDAAFVYEGSNVGTILEQLPKRQFVKSLLALPTVSNAYQGINRVDSILNEQKTLAFLNKTPFLVSAHNTAKSTVDFLFVAEVRSISQHDQLNQLLEKLVSGGYRKKNREYLDFTITELTNREQKTFTFIFFKNYFIGSFTAFLVEDAIRTKTSETTKSFRQAYEELQTIAKLEKDQGNLYINYSQASKLSDVFTSLPLPADFMHSSFLDFTIEDKSIELSGFAYAQADQTLSQLSGNLGAPFDMAEVITNETAMLIHFGMRDIQKWKQQLPVSNRIAAARQKLQSALDFDVLKTFDFLDQEVALATHIKNGRKEKTLILESTKSAELVQFLDEICQRHQNATGDSVFIEQFRESQIGRLPTNQFPETLIGEIASDFRNGYYTHYRNYVLVASSLPTLMEILEDTENENTWDKSLRKRQFLDRINPEAAMSIYVSTPNIWDEFAKSIHSNWGQSLLQYDYILKSYEHIAIQFNPVDGKYFTNVFIEQQENAPSGETSTQTLKSITFSQPLIGKPHLVRNHNNADYETLVQDSSNHLYLIDKDFEVLWNKPLGGSIRGAVKQLDYFKNGKLQYAFISSDSLYLIDRNGDWVDNFPVAINGAKILDHFTIIDYNGSKNYRYAVTDEEGAVFITDKQGKPLEGWDPKRFDSPLSGPLRHFRIGGTDVFSVVLENGDMHLFSRRGREFPGFPIQTGLEIKSDYHLRPGSRFASSRWTVLSTSGDLFTVDLKGSTVDRKQLYKPDPFTKFELIKDVAGRQFVVSKRTESNLSISSPDDEVIFEKDYLAGQDIFVQYYRLGSTRNYVLVGDRQGKYIYTYDLNGRLITNRPLPGNLPVGMIYYEKKDEQNIYLARQNQLMLSLIDGN